MAKTAGFDRSKFKGAKVATNKASMEEAQSKVESGRGGRAGYLKITEGKNVFRIAPPHNDENPACEPISKVWLPRKMKDGNDKDIVKNMPVFNSCVHSPIGKDIVDAYVDFAMKFFYKELSKDEAKKKTCHITGYKDKSGKWISGIRPQLTWDAYAWKGEEFGRINFSKGIVDRMNELSIDEESDDPITMDPFSDPDTGVSLIIEYSPKEDAKDRYKVNKGSKVKQLTDEQLQMLDESESLADMLRNAYTREDFNNAVEGLRIFDEKHEYGIMEMEEFVTIMEEIKELLWDCPDVRESNKTEGEDDDTEEKSSKKAPVKEVKKEIAKAAAKKAAPVIEDDKEEEESEEEETEEEVDDDGLDDLDKDDLKAYIEENEMNIVVKDAYPKSKIITMIRDYIKASKDGAANDLPFEVKTEPKKDDGEKTSTKDRLAAMKKKSGGK